MYEIANRSRYSYFSLPDNRNNFEHYSSNNEDHLSRLELEIKQIEKEENYLDYIYSTSTSGYNGEHAYYNDWNSESDNSDINRLSKINSQKRELGNKKRELLGQLETYRKYETPFRHSIPMTSEAYQRMGNFNCDKIDHQPVPVKNNFTKIDYWSLELFNYTASRILNKQKFLSPGSFLRETCGTYNYTYFNNQIPEQMEIFDYNAPSMNSAIVKAASKLPVVPEPVIQMKPVLQSSQQPPPFITSKIICINDIINRSVDSRHVIILRGLPGSGKTSFCQAFKEKEILNSRSPPRILSVDHFFVEEGGKFEYDSELEPTYRHELFKLFKRQIDEGFFSVILLDCINERVEQFSQFYQYAKINRFQVSVLELKVSPTIGAKRSEQRFTAAQVYKMADDWEDTPAVYDKLDATSFLQDSSIEDVEMEDIVDLEKPEEESDSDQNSISETGFFKSKWDEDFEDTKERLDGMKQVSHETQPSLSIKEYLKIEMENLNKLNLDDKAKGKQVKWADFEELKKQKRRKELGFVAGNTDWVKLMSNDIEVAEAALVQVRYFTKDGE